MLQKYETVFKMVLSKAFFSQGVKHKESLEEELNLNVLHRVQKGIRNKTLMLQHCIINVIFL